VGLPAAAWSFGVGALKALCEMTRQMKAIARNADVMYTNCIESLIYNVVDEYFFGYSGLSRPCLLYRILISRSIDDGERRQTSNNDQRTRLS
jgi:hypothetical protein